jgi:predicted TIM-barrel fold metal-dependent hydrolase
VLAPLFLFVRFAIEPHLFFCYNPAVIIDFHAHIFSPDLINSRDDYSRQDPCFAELYNNSRAKMATAEELIAAMDIHHIDMSVVCNIGWTEHALCVESNDYILESVSRYPQRLLGLAAIQPNAGDDALKELERCIKAGARGVGEMRPDIQSFDMTNDNLLTPLVNCLMQHGCIWLNHASEPLGHNYAGKGALTPQVLYPFICRFPELNIVLAHWGGGMPFYTLMPEVQMALKRVYFDTAASPYLYSPSVYSRVIDLVGAEHMLFGTDFPLIPQNRQLKEIEDLCVSQSDKSLILGSNAQKLLHVRS